MGFVVVFFIVMLIISMYAHETTEVPKIKNKKEEFSKKETEFLKENGIRATSVYLFEEDYYKNNISENSNAISFIVDQLSKRVAIITFKGFSKIISFGDIIGCEILCNSKVMGGVKRAIVGDLIAGDTGAIVGAMTAKDHIMSYKIVLYTKDISSQKVELSLINKKTTAKSTDYINAVKFAEDINAVVKAIVSQ